MSGVGNDRRTGGDRWWEFYFLRYFVGTVVGGSILYYLNGSTTSALHNLIVPSVTAVWDLGTGAIWLLGALGFTYCYIASAPIFVLHVARLGYLRTNWLPWRVWLVGAALLAGIALFDWHGTRSVHDVIATVLFCVCVLLESAAVAFVLWKGEAVHIYYCDLASSRAGSGEPIREYVESYRHLREHGNAYLILLFEVVLGIVLSRVRRPSLAIIAVIIWTLPAAINWFVGHILEYRMVEDESTCAGCARIRNPGQ